MRSCSHGHGLIMQYDGACKRCLVWVGPGISKISLATLEPSKVGIWKLMSIPLACPSCCLDNPHNWQVPGRLAIEQLPSEDVRRLQQSKLPRSAPTGCPAFPFPALHAAKVPCSLIALLKISDKPFFRLHMIHIASPIATPPISTPQASKQQRRPKH